MFGEHHRLEEEFPEYKQKIHQLKLSDSHFARLFGEYVDIDKQIYRIEEAIETVSDNFAEELKKKRLSLKDKLYAMLRQS
ncbi:MAG: YdcH family protein [Gammaproteobacteria bacterium]|nr:YdcH family protein [Gammaproteobacteria bacterium]